jgi:hypothetical protein
MDEPAIPRLRRRRAASARRGGPGPSARPQRGRDSPGASALPRRGRCLARARPWLGGARAAPTRQRGAASTRRRGLGSAARRGLNSAAWPWLGSAARPQLGGVALARQCGVTPARLPGARPSTRPRAQSSAHGARSELGRRAARAALPSLPRGAVQCASSARSPGVAVAWCPARPWRATSAPGAVLARG